MRVGLVQMCSTEDLQSNLREAQRCIAQAAAGGAELVLLPENALFLRTQAATIPALDPDRLRLIAEVAAQHGVTVVLGSYAEPATSPPLVHNTSVVFGPDGGAIARYRKIHLFRAHLADGVQHDETRLVQPGTVPVVADTPVGRLGLSICYDLRFPALYQALAHAGADMIAVPAAFTVPTGQAHWQVLLRARAIECQAYVLAPAQCGLHGHGRSSYGHSMVVDPWGVVVAELGDEPAVLVVDIDLERVANVRRRIPSLADARPIAAASVWPAG